MELFDRFGVPNQVPNDRLDRALRAVGVAILVLIALFTAWTAASAVMFGPCGSAIGVHCEEAG